MFSSTLTSFVTFAVGLAHLSRVLAVPLVDARMEAMSPKARDVLARATPSAPHFVIYSDRSTGTAPPAASEIEGYNVFALSFLLLEGPWDNVEVWSTLDAADRASIISDYHSAGISLVASAFGSTDVPTSSGADPTDTANTMAAFIKEYDLDGIDVDYEDFAAIEDAGTGPAWLATFTTALRVQLPQGDYILTHAPVAPWFSPGLYPNNAYLQVNSDVGNLIDWYNIQFYNQGTSEYTDCAGLLTTSGAPFPNSALFQIAANGVSLDKLVIGKLGTTGDGNNGYVDPATLATCVSQAQSQGWDAGVMVWQYPDADASWIATVRADSWPVSGSGSSISGPTTVSTTSTTKTSKTSTSTTSTTTSSSGGGGGGTSCSTASAWTSAVAYTQGSEVTYNGSLWTATQWNEDEVPGGQAGAWQQTGTCAALAHIASTEAKHTKPTLAIAKAAAAPSPAAPKATKA